MSYASETLKKYLPLASLSFQITITIGLMALLGFWLDKKFDISPWALLGCLVVGIGSAIRATYQEIKRFKEKYPEDF